MKNWSDISYNKSYEIAYIGEEENFEQIDGIGHEPVLYRRKWEYHRSRDIDLTLYHGFIKERYLSRASLEFFNEYAKSIPRDSFMPSVLKKYDGPGIKSLATDNQLKDILKNIPAGDSVKTARPGLNIPADQLGFVSAALFAGLLVLGAIFQEILVSPFIAWPIIIFGISFGFMKKIER